MKISVIVSYCSLDKRFIKPLLLEIEHFSDDIIIVAFDHLFDGTVETFETVKSIISEVASKAKLIIIPFERKNNARFHHNLARWVGATNASNEWCLFLDSDEIPDGSLLQKYLINISSGNIHACSFECYWYFRSAKYRAIQTENCGLFLKRELIHQKLFFTESERWVYKYLKGITYKERITSDNGPLFHHFSWVRTKDETLKKVNGWGHREDRDWKSLVDMEFSKPFSGTDFVHGYQYVNVEDRFAIGL